MSTSELLAKIRAAKAARQNQGEQLSTPSKKLEPQSSGTSLQSASPSVSSVSESTASAPSSVQITNNTVTILETSTKPSKLPYELAEKVLALQSAILNKHPTMPTLLREIHTVLRQQPENVTLASEEEIGIIVSGLMLQTNTVLAKSANGKDSGKKAAIAQIKQLGLDAI